MPFKKNLSLLFASDTTKTLCALIDENPLNYTNEKLFEKLIDLYDNTDPKATKEEVCEKLLIQAGKQKTWAGALSSLMIIHRVIHKLGSQGFNPVNIGNAKETSHFSQFKSKDTSPAGLLHGPHVTYYFKYLKRLSYGYDDFHICFFPHKTLPESFLRDNLSFIHFLSRLQNLMESILQILPLFEVSLLQFPEYNLVKHLVYLYLTDCFYYYTYLNQAIMALLVKVYSLPVEDKLSVFELYIEHLKITKNLQDCFELTKYLPEFLFKVPQFYAINPEFHSRFSYYMCNLKNVSKDYSNHEIESPTSPIRISFSTHDNSHDSPPTTLTSLNEIAKITLVMIHPNRFFNPSSHTPLYDAPNPLYKKHQPSASMSHIRSSVRKSSIHIEPLRSERQNYVVEEPPIVVKVATVRTAHHSYCEQTFAKPRGCPTIVEESFCKTSEQGSVPKVMRNFKFFLSATSTAPGLASAC